MKAKKILIILSLPIIIIFVLNLRNIIIFFREKEVIINYFKEDEFKLQGFQYLQSLPKGAKIIAFFDWRFGIEGIGGREALVKYPSRALIKAKGIARTTFLTPNESPKKAKDIATLFLSNKENDALDIMKQYNTEYILVVFPDDLKHLLAIVADDPFGRIITDYCIPNEKGVSFESVTPLGKNTNFMKLCFDNRLKPEKFKKLFDNGKIKIFTIKKIDEQKQAR